MSQIKYVVIQVLESSGKIKRRYSGVWDLRDSTSGCYCHPCEAQAPDEGPLGPLAPPTVRGTSSFTGHFNWEGSWNIGWFQTAGDTCLLEQGVAEARGCCQWAGPRWGIPGLFPTHKSVDTFIDISESFPTGELVGMRPGSQCCCQG